MSLAGSCSRCPTGSTGYSVPEVRFWFSIESVGQDPRDSKSNLLNGDIHLPVLMLSFIPLRYILPQIPLKMIGGKSPQVSNFTQPVLSQTQPLPSATNRWFFPDIIGLQGLPAWTGLLPSTTNTIQSHCLIPLVANPMHWFCQAFNCPFVGWRVVLLICDFAMFECCLVHELK